MASAGAKALPAEAEEVRRTGRGVCKRAASERTPGANPCKRLTQFDFHRPNGGLAEARLAPRGAMCRFLFGCTPSKSLLRAARAVYRARPGRPSLKIVRETPSHAVAGLTLGRHRRLLEAGRSGRET